MGHITITMRLYYNRTLLFCNFQNKTETLTIHYVINEIYKTEKVETLIFLIPKSKSLLKSDLFYYLDCFLFHFDNIF